MPERSTLDASTSRSVGSITRATPKHRQLVGDSLVFDVSGRCLAGSLMSLLVRRQRLGRLSMVRLPYRHLQGEAVTERLDISAQGSERIGIVAPLLDAGDLCLRNSKALGNLSLG